MVLMRDVVYMIYVEKAFK